MYSSTANIRTLMADFHIAGMMLRYSAFIPRLYNLCKSLEAFIHQMEQAREIRVAAP